MTWSCRADEDVIERVANRVAQLLEPRVARRLPELVDVETLAQALGLSSSYVYEHQDELGVIRLGTGPHAPLRFDLEKLLDELTACSTSRESDPPPPPSAKPKRAPRRRSAPGADRDLLPITPPKGLK